MRIMIVTDAWVPQVNGVVRTLKMTSRQLEAWGHRVEFLHPGGFRQIPCPTYPEIALAMTTPTIVAKRIDAFQPDCLHIATEGPLGWWARQIARERNWPFSTAYHSRFPEYLHARFRLPLQWSYALLRRFHNGGVSTMAPTPAIVRDLTERGFHHARLWSRGVDLSMFQPVGDTEPRTSAPVFLYVGRLAVEKQVDAFLRLDLPGEKWVAGDGPAATDLKRRFPDTRWFGVLDGHSLARLYRSADVFVFPSITDTFGLVMIEAMACGTPVAAFPVPGPIDVVGPESGVLHNDLQTACLHAWSKGFSRDRIRSWAEKFSWPAATQQFLFGLRKIDRHGA